jgi:hypothetical protein
MAMVAVEPVICIGCEAELPDDAAYLVHVQTCPRHPLAPIFARHRDEHAAIVAWATADAAQQAFLDLEETQRDPEASMACFRALWAAERRLRALAGMATPASQVAE